LFPDFQIARAFLISCFQDGLSIGAILVISALHLIPSPLSARRTLSRPVKGLPR
jgi:hypothetical protein